MPRYRSKMLDTDSIKLGRISFEDAASLKEKDLVKRGSCLEKKEIVFLNWQFLMIIHRII